MSIEAGNSHKAQSVPYMECFALCCCKVSANLCMSEQVNPGNEAMSTALRVGAKHDKVC